MVSPPAEIVLVVDDHLDTREALAVCVEADGYTVVTAANGREALDLLRAGLRPCVILMDLMMPVMSGYEFRERQLSEPALAGIPFIAYSAAGDVEHAAARLRADGFLLKPAEPQHVLALIRQHRRATA